MNLKHVIDSILIHKNNMHPKIGRNQNNNQNCLHIYQNYIIVYGNQNINS